MHFKFFVAAGLALVGLGCDSVSDFNQHGQGSDSASREVSDESQLSQPPQSSDAEASRDADETGAVDIPKNILGTYLKADLSAKENQIELRVEIRDRISDQTLMLGPDERIEWDWDKSLGDHLRLASEETVLHLRYDRPAGDLIPRIEAMAVQARWIGSQGEQHELRSSVLDGISPQEFDSNSFNIVATNTSVSIQINHSIQEGQYLIVRRTDGDPAFYPLEGTAYVPNRATSGPVYAGLDQAFFEDNLSEGAHYSYFLWHQKPDLSYVLLGHWRTYTGFFTAADFLSVDFSGHSLLQTEAAASRFVNVDFSGSDLRASQFSGADLVDVNFEAADLRGANFSGANLVNINLSGANLSGATWNDGSTICADGSIGRCL